MEVEFAFLARAVQHNTDGTLDIQGCGVTDFVVSELPAMLPLMLVLRLRMGQSGRREPQRLVVSLADSHGRIKSPPLRELRLGVADAGARTSRRQPSPLAFEVTVTAGQAGAYQLVVQGDRRAMATVPFEVILEQESSSKGWW